MKPEEDVRNEMKRPSESIGTSLVKSVWAAGVAEVATDVAEIALDAVLDEGVLKEIPVFGWFVKGYGVVSTVRDRVFLKKLATFFSGLGRVNEDEKNEFRENIETDDAFCRKVGENIVLLLDRQDSFDKAYILGKVFSGYLRGRIDYQTFLQLAAAIDRAFIGDLVNLETHYAKIESYDAKLGKPFAEFLDDATSQALYSAGLVRSEGYTEDTYHANELGSCLIRLLRE